MLLAGQIAFTPILVTGLRLEFEQIEHVEGTFGLSSDERLELFRAGLAGGHESDSDSIEDWVD